MKVPVLPSSLPVACELLKILPLSDLHLKAKPSATQLLLSNREYFARMDFVQLLGDMVASYGTDDEYSHLAHFIDRLEKPYGAINGNHEFYFEVHDEDSGENGRIWKEASAAEKQFQLEKFQRFFELENAWRAERNLFGTFLFLALDDVQNSKPETLSTPQLQWLETQLKESSREPVYVFCHAPLFLGKRLDMTYYDDERTACVELENELLNIVSTRRAPLFWMSGHIHLRPDHYLFAPYELAKNVWQIHCPDSWGYSRWAREHRIPQRHDGLFSRHLEIARDKLVLVTHDHLQQQDIAQQSIEFDNIA